MKKIFLIGGGEIAKKETQKIDRDIIKEGGGVNAKILFFPTAANDSDDYIKNFIDYFLYLGCNNILWAKLSREPKNNIIKKINWATIIYFGGGDTNHLIELFRKKGLIKHIEVCLNRGVVLVGMSAGAIAMTKTAIISEIKNDLRFGNGFGFLPKIICLPHYQKKYKDTLNRIGSKFPDKLIFGIPEKSALYIKGDHIKYYNRCFKI